MSGWLIAYLIGLAFFLGGDTTDMIRDHDAGMPANPRPLLTSLVWPLTVAFLAVLWLVTRTGDAVARLTRLRR